MPTLTATAKASVPASSRRYTDDDGFIHTISDSDVELPELDGDSGHQSDIIEPSHDSAAQNRKRKERPFKPNGSDTSNSKRKRMPRDSASASASEAEDERDNGTFDPNFEFVVGDERGNTVSGFKGWDIPVGNTWEQGFEGTRKRVGIDEIIERRRERENVGLGEKGDALSGEEIEDEREDIDTFDELNQENDEFLAEDGFGMGAEPDADKDSDYDRYEHEEHNDVNGAQASDESDSVADPVPHPDDISDDEQEDAAMKQRQAAFFAPEEPGANMQPLSGGSNSFQSMSLSRPILKGISASSFMQPTPIQIKTIPIALLGKDVVGGAVTGSGKTAAFIIPILERLLYRPRRVPTTRVSILMPTRELAVQCYNVATKLASFTDISFALIVGGLSLREQEQTLKKRPDVVIATPGRFIDHMRNSASFAVDNMEILVLDEADRMLEDGFADELNEILATIPKSRQTMLFSATMTENVDKLVRAGLNRPVRLMVDSKKQTVYGLVQEFIKMKGNKEGGHDNRRLAYLLHLCGTTYTSKTIIFFQAKKLAHRVKVLFSLHGLKAAELHGSMSQEQRLNAIASFREGSSTHLLATDLASRGLDIPRVETVINFTVPTTATTYLHRVGRTARAGQSGVSCTLFSSAKTSSGSSKKDAKASGSSKLERTLLRPILRLARNQGANIRTRTLPSTTIDELTGKIQSRQEEIDSILREEAEERLLQQTERDVQKGENLVRYEDEIASRPKRTWFQSEKEKRASSKLGTKEHAGVENGATAKRDKRKLSGKDKRRLASRGERLEGNNQGWKKGKEDRANSGAVIGSHEKKKKQKARSAPNGTLKLR